MLRRISKGWTPPFSLHSIKGMYNGMWLDFTEKDRFFQNNDGTNKVTASGQTVGSVVERIENRLIAAPTGANEPTAVQGGEGKFKWTLNFDGTNDYLTTATITGLDTSGFSVIAWIKCEQLPSVADDEQFIVRYLFNQTPWHLWNLSIGTDNKVKWSVRQADATNAVVSSDLAISVNTWYCIVARVSFDGILLLYTNGALSSTASLTGGIYDALEPTGLRVGSNSGTTNNFIGKIAHLGFSSQFLGSTECDKIYRWMHPL